MKTHYGILAISIVAALALAGCGNTKHKGPGRVYDSKYGFSIVPPGGYTKSDPIAGCFMVYTGPMVSGFASNFNVNASRDDGTKVEAMGAVLKPMFKRMMTDYNFEQEGFITIDGKKCYYISSSFTQGSFRLRNLQYCIRGDNGKVYVMTFTTTSAAFDSERPTFEAAALTAATD